METLNLQSYFCRFSQYFWVSSSEYLSSFISYASFMRFFLQLYTWLHIFTLLWFIIEIQSTLDISWFNITWYHIPLDINKGKTWLRLTKDTPYLALAGKTWCVLCEFHGGSDGNITRAPCILGGIAGGCMYLSWSVISCCIIGLAVLVVVVVVVAVAVAVAVAAAATAAVAIAVAVAVAGTGAGAAVEVILFPTEYTQWGQNTWVTL